MQINYGVMKRKRDPSDDGSTVDTRYRRFHLDSTVPTYSSRTVLPYKPLPEKKYYDVARVATSIQALAGISWTTATNINPITQKCLFCPTQGVDTGDRIGKKVQVCKIMIRGIISCQQQNGIAEPINNTHVRLILMLHKQCNGLEAVPSECINSTIGTGYYAMTAFQNTSYLGKYRVLKDKVFRMPPTTLIGTTGAGTVDITGYEIPFKLTHIFKQPITVHFQSNFGTVADIVSNSLSLCCGTYQTGTLYQISYTARTTFMDI